MHITRLDLSPQKPDDPDGLSGELSRLGQVVVLSGPNGAGKSRILQRVQALATAWPIYASLQRAREKFASLQRNAEAAAVRATLGSTAGDATTAASQLALDRARFSVHLLESVDIARPVANGRTVWRFLPSKKVLEDDHKLRLHEVRERADQALTSSAASAASFVTSRIRVLQDAWWNATHQANQPATAPYRRAIEAYERLDADIERVLGTRLGRSPQGDPLLFGRRIPEARLSAGQSFLLQLVVLVHAQSSMLGEAILLLDEPETHLHPAAALDVLTTLRDVCTKGQLWIATHSLPILAWAHPDELWYVDEGRVSWAGRSPERVLRGLLGGDEGRERMEDFLQLPAQYASNRFASECLLPPGVADPNTTDPQLAQIRAHLIDARADDRPLRVLDVGAGKARLLAALREASSEGLARFDYIAFDPDRAHHGVRDEALVEAYGTSKHRNFVEPEDLRSALDPESVDVAVLCNVLHEIRPQDWSKMLGVGSALHTLLRPDGHLLVVEDQHIPVGEQAHRHGFLLLDVPQLRDLFGVKERGPSITTASDGRGRLNAHLIPASLLANVTMESTRKALKSLQRSAKEEVQRLRGGNATSTEGRLHGLWTQLYANASLALDDFE